MFAQWISGRLLSTTFKLLRCQITLYIYLSPLSLSSFPIQLNNLVMDTFHIHPRIKKLIDIEALGLSRLAVILLDMHPDVKGYSLLTLPQLRFDFDLWVNPSPSSLTLYIYNCIFVCYCLQLFFLLFSMFSSVSYWIPPSSSP